MSTTEKAHVMRQVWTGKANASEPLLKCRKRSDGNRNRGPVVALGKARGIGESAELGRVTVRESWTERGPAPLGSRVSAEGLAALDTLIRSLQGR